MKDKIIYCGLVIIATVFFACKKDNSEAAIENNWRTDSMPIEKRIPLLGPVESCIWRGGQKSFNSGGGVPAPEEYYIQGYLLISSETKERILKEFTWENTSINEFKMAKPISPSLADKFFNSSNILLSKDFIRRHVETSSFSNGIILFNVDVNTFYFDLSNN